MYASDMLLVINHFDNGGDILVSLKGENKFSLCSNPNWNFNKYDYKVLNTKEIMIEKWLCKRRCTNAYVVVEANQEYFKRYQSRYEKIRLITSYLTKLEAEA